MTIPRASDHDLLTEQIHDAIASLDLRQHVEVDPNQPCYVDTGDRSQAIIIAGERRFFVVLYEAT